MKTVCLSEKIRWHGQPNVFQKNAIRCSVEYDKETKHIELHFDLNMKRITRKRFVRLLTAHGLSPRGARGIAELFNKKGVTYTDGYRFIVKTMDEYMKMKQDEQKGA